MGESGGTPRRGRRAAIAAAVVLALALTVIAYRVLAPTEVVTPARGGYPPAPTAAPGVIARLPVAPLIVDGRLRLYAATRQVRADGPVDAEAQLTPYWSYRRWPQRLVGVVAVGSTVVSRWSDGKLVAIDAGTGRLAWRVAGPPPPSPEYAGRRTGAVTVYDPPGLHTATGPDGRAAVVVAGRGGVRGYDPRTGGELWRVDGDCERAAFTTATGWYVARDACAPAYTLRFRDAVTGRLVRDWRPHGADRFEPLGCGAARSDCRGLRTGGTGGERGWLFDPAGPTAAPGLDRSGAWLVDELAVTLDDGTLTARGARDGGERWRTGVPGGAETRLIAARSGRVHLLTPERELVTVDAATGAERSRFVLKTGREKTNWAPGFVYAAAGFVAVERLTEPVDPRADDDRYYRSADPIIFAAT